MDGQRRYEHHLRIGGVDEDTANLLRVGKSDRLPAPPGIRRSKEARALRDIRAHIGLAAARIENLGVRRCDRDGANRAHRR